MPDSTKTPKPTSRGGITRSNTFRLGKETVSMLDEMCLAYGVTRTQAVRYAISVLYANYKGGFRPKKIGEK